jgi:uncharacterized protein
MTLDYRLNDDAGATRVDIDVDLTLSGPIAQFGRTGLVTETANVLIADFARNLEDRISTSARTADNGAQPARRINVLAVLLEAVRTRIRILFGRQT